MKNSMIILSVCIHISVVAVGQKIYPVVGEPLPEVHFFDVQYHERSSLSNNDFKGKWMVLYAWNRYCALCLKKMPLLSRMQANFQDKVNFLLVGYNGTRYTKKSDDKDIRLLYERNRVEEKLKLSIAYDSLMFHHFNLGPSPYIIIVDPRGVVRYITSDINESQMEDILQGKAVWLRKAYRRNEHLKPD